MLIWKKVVEDARKEQIDVRPSAARRWMSMWLPSLFDISEGSSGKQYRRPRFSLKKIWPEWQSCFKALIWLAKQREQPPTVSECESDVIPPEINDVIDRVLLRTRNRILSDHFSGAKLTIQLSGQFGSSGRFSSVDEFWEAVFVSFFRPEALQINLCGECGKVLGNTIKTKRPSRARMCSRCRLKNWRKANPERQREQWRDAKSRERRK